jgi:hypothetical protein
LTIPTGELNSSKTVFDLKRASIDYTAPFFIEVKGALVEMLSGLNQVIAECCSM